MEGGRGNDRLNRGTYLHADLVRLGAEAGFLGGVIHPAVPNDNDPCDGSEAGLGRGQAGATGNCSEGAALV